MKIGVIGLGNMAKAILSGMLAKGIVTKEDVIGSAAMQATIDKVREQYGIAVTLDNREVAKGADVLLLAVKPQFMADVIGQIRDDVTEDTLVITIAAGKTINWYEEAFGKKRDRAASEKEYQYGKNIKKIVRLSEVFRQQPAGSDDQGYREPVR